MRSVWTDADVVAPNTERNVRKVAQPVQALADKARQRAKSKFEQEHQQCRAGGEFTKRKSMSIPDMAVRLWPGSSPLS
jgi:heme-binding NEAT domain protein